MPNDQLTIKNQVRKEKEVEKICLFAQTNFRNQMRRFGIKTDDRRRHMYVIGKTGMGKTTMLENMVLQDIYNGHGIGVVDPHGDFAEKIINYIPANRINDVVYINPADVEYPVGFNILEVENEEQKHLVAAGLMAVFKKIWPDVWSARMEYILNNTLLALLDYEGSTLLGINRLLADKKFRKKVLRKLKDPVIKSFWNNEFANYEPRYQKEAVAPIQNKIGQFLSASVIRNMVAQVKSTINVREIMDTNKILIMNLSKGRIGEDNSRLLGGMLITEIQLAAMSRVDMPEEERKDFFLYVDEFQNFATPSFANILSEARKYRLSLIMAHQYVMQLDEVVADAVFGNVGSMVTFRVGAGDAEMLEKEYSPTFVIEDIVNLPKFQIFLKLMIDGVASQPFSAATMPPIGSATGSAEKVIKVSRERYGKNRSVIEEKIIRWSGMEADDDDDDGEDGGGKGSSKKQESKRPKRRDESEKKQEGKKLESKEPTKQEEPKASPAPEKTAIPREKKEESNKPVVFQEEQPGKEQKQKEETRTEIKVQPQASSKPKLHTDAIQPKQEIEAPPSAKDEPVVHLADLLPKEKSSVDVVEEAEPVSSITKKRTIPPIPLSFINLEETVEDFVESAKREEEREDEKQEKGERPPEDVGKQEQSSSEQGDGDGQKKRKRKRKRNRKKKNGNGNGNGKTAGFEQPRGHTPEQKEKKQLEPASAAPQQKSDVSQEQPAVIAPRITPLQDDVPPKTIKPDQVVTFGDDGDA